LLHTTDGGTKWTAIAFTSLDLYGLAFVDADHGWVAGYGGTLLRISSSRTGQAHSEGVTSESAQPATSGRVLHLYAAGARFGYTGVNVRTHPRLDAPVITYIPNGEQVVVVGPAFRGGNGDDWYKVKLATAMGYARAKVLGQDKPEPMPALYVDTSEQGFAAVNLRAQPSTEAAIKLVIPNGMHIPAMVGTVTNPEGKTWYRIVFAEQSGYVLGSLLSHIGPPPTDKLVAQLGLDASHVAPLMVDDTDFTGGFSRHDGLYKGHTARWVYSQKTRFARMHAIFDVQATPLGNNAGNVGLGLVGMDSEDSAKTPIRIAINGHTVYQGLDPLPNDFSPYNPEQGNWGEATLTFPASYLKPGANDLEITDLASEGRVGHVPFFLLDYAVVVVYQA
jgi:uncharacterized protein YraI